MVTKQEQYHFYGSARPPIVIAQRIYRFVCVTCRKPAESYSPNCNTHPGECRDAQIAKVQAKASANARKRRAARRSEAARPK